MLRLVWALEAAEYLAAFSKIVSSIIQCMVTKKICLATDRNLQSWNDCSFGVGPDQPYGKLISY